MKIINLCPHPIHIKLSDPEREIIYQPSGVVARCEEVTHPAYTLNDIPIVTKSYGYPTDLPCYEKNAYIWYIVSMMIRLACPDRRDLLSPGDVVRDAEGKIIGCINLVTN
jgi:hypothetical protein